MSRPEILVEREKTHGIFANNAYIYYRFKQVAGISSNQAQQLALEMIYLKLARAVCMPHIKDHWDDIAGYAKLAAESCGVKS